MPLKQELRWTFALAALRQQSDYLTTPRHWAQANAFKERAQRLRVHEREDFRARYDSRVEMARRRLMHKAGELNRDLTPIWSGIDRFSPDALLRQAQREVRMAHERRLMRIGKAEERMLASVIQRAAGENMLKGRAVIDFTRASRGHKPDDGPKNSGPSRS